MTDGQFRKFKQERPFADPRAAARKLMEIARSLPVDEGRMCVGKWNDLFRAAGGSVDEYAAGRDHAIADGVIVMHECGGLRDVYGERSGPRFRIERPRPFNCR
jgi:hypothetical protein